VDPDTGCVFCDEPWRQVRHSKEHVLPQWMRKHEQALLTSSRTRSSFGLSYDEQHRVFDELPAAMVTSKASLLHLTTRKVCEPCNTGWMARLEMAAEPLVLQMAEAARTGEPAPLTVASARTLSLWCQKTSITLELSAAKPDNIPAGFPGATGLAAGKLPRGSCVWAARHPRDYDLATAQACMEIADSPVPEPGDPSWVARLTSFVYHQLSFLVFTPERPGRPLPAPFRPEQWTLIWPATSPPDYPPLEVINGSELTATFMSVFSWLPAVHAQAIRRRGATS
jgi:hypothetical protein